eukprot:m.61150 g.61150  ORF g.61150 m.61150 type:complete len:78 (+) comp13711_c0_seq7:251-484(+)
MASFCWVSSSVGRSSSPASFSLSISLSFDRRTASALLPVYVFAQDRGSEMDRTNVNILITQSPHLAQGNEKNLIQKG